MRSTIDQSHNVEPKIEAMIQSVDEPAGGLREGAARRPRRARARAGGGRRARRDTARCVDAFHTDVRPLCAKVRADLGASADPIAAFRADGYADRVARRAHGGKAAAWL